MKTECYDLHCHSLASDGSLSPTALIMRAAEQGVTDLALTDHDTTAGLLEARQTAETCNINLIPGIEISTSWKNKCFHIIGLNINPENEVLQQGLKDLQHTRQQRAKKIADKLARQKIFDAYPAVIEMTSGGMPTRTHFAEFLLTRQYVSTMQEAFDRYLAQGKPAFVATQWAELDAAIAWITGAGGIAVLAHPMRYKITASWMRRLLDSFKAMGGGAIEVVSGGRNNPDEIHRSAEYARKFSLSGSVGSDFHNPDNVWTELGRLAALPAGISPVWHLF